MSDNENAAAGGMVQELRDAAERLVADMTDHGRTRKLRNSLPGHDADMWNTIVEMGFLGIMVPEEAGGIGLGLQEMAAVVRALEKGLLSGPLIELGVLGARTLVHAGDSELGGQLLGGLLDGSALPALALDLDAELPALRLEDGRLSGTCGSVPGAALATHFLLPVMAGGALTLHVVPRDSDGLTIGNRWRADGSAEGVLTLDGVTGASLLVAGEAASDAIATAMDEARIIASAGLQGLSEHMLDMTVEYMKVRKQFDQAIGSFQALQHKAVDLFVQKEIAGGTLEFALDEGSKESADLSLRALRAKGRTSAVAMRIGRESIQLHGAIGYTDEHDLGLYVKRAMVLSAWLGNAMSQRRAYIKKGLVIA